MKRIINYQLSIIKVITVLFLAVSIFLVGLDSCFAINPSVIYEDYKMNILAVDTDTGQSAGDRDTGQSVGDNDTGQASGDNDTGQSEGDNDTGASKPPQKPAQTSNNSIFTLQNPLKVNSIGALLQSLMEIFTYLVIIFAVLMLIWTGFQYVVVSTQGDAKKISELHNRLMWIVIGVAVVIGARVIIEVVINTISATGTVSPGIIDSANKAVQRR